MREQFTTILHEHFIAWASLIEFIQKWHQILKNYIKKDYVEKYINVVNRLLYKLQNP